MKYKAKISALLVSLLLVMSANLFATDTVRINDPNNLVITGFTNTSFTMGSKSASGDATAESAPATVYIPIKSTGLNNLQYSILAKTSNVTSLFDITSTVHQITFPLLITVGSTAKYLYWALRGGGDGTSYYISGRTASTYSDYSSSLLNFSLSPFDICKSVIANSSSLVCNSGTGGLDPASTAATLYKPMIYFFLTDQVLPVDGRTVIDPANANYSGGVYFEAQMTNRIYDSSTLVVTMGSFRKGDGRLVGSFSASTTMDTTLFKKVIAYQYTDTTTAITSNLPIGAASAGSILSNDISSLQSGDFTLSGLINSQNYKISLAFEDNFLFATTLSTSQIGTPTQIEELLKKQACFLLTAGFGEEHYVISYFRHYRDHVLSNSFLGKKFIHFYYQTAPKYALIIYKHEVIRSTIRLFAYLLYFFFNFYWLILGITFLLTFFIFKKNKMSFSK